MTRSVFIHRRRSGWLLSQDSFNRADSTTTMSTTDGGGTLDPLTWATGNGVCGISSNQAYDSTSVGHATVDLATANVDIQITLATVGTASGLAFRYQNATNYFQYRNSGTNTQLFSIIGGTGTQIGGNQAGAAAGDVLQVIANGTSIRCYRNGVLLITTTHSSFLTQTKHGLYMNGTTVRLDNWVARTA